MSKIMKPTKALSLKKRTKRIKIAITAACFTVVAFMLVSVSTYIHIYGTAKHTSWPDSRLSLSAATTVIVLGMGPTPTHAIVDRSELAAELWHAGFVSQLIASGGQGIDEVESEAQTIAKDLISRGVPESIITEEPESTSTYENLIFSRKILAAREKMNTHIVIITHDFHAARVASMADSLGMNAVVISSSGPRLNNRGRRYAREVLAFLKWKIVGR
jgi:vancomycin permeability regulator SanA